MLSIQSSANNHRYERKFFISHLSRQQVECLVKLHPAMFSEIFHQRCVNNIYFDSPNFNNYSDNIEGSTDRIKVRIRWYDALFGRIEAPVLELKIKKGFLSRKESFRLHPFEIENSFNIPAISHAIGKSAIPEMIKIMVTSLEPVLLNRYSRKYFQSADGDYRITVDTDLVFYRISYQGNSFLNKLGNDRDIILELKYGQNLDDNVSKITTRFPFRLSKSSKYVNGIDKLYV